MTRCGTPYHTLPLITAFERHRQVDLFESLVNLVYIIHYASQGYTVSKKKELTVVDLGRSLSKEMVTTHCEYWSSNS